MWEWSHTQEAYDNAKENLHCLPIPLLIEIASEWEANVSREHFAGGFHPGKYRKAERKLQKLYRRSFQRNGNMKVPSVFAFQFALAETIWKFASEQRDCSNGGWEAYMCPYGCGCHSVSFDKERKE
jgi:hypothetical protein